MTLYEEGLRSAVEHVWRELHENSEKAEQGLDLDDGHLCRGAERQRRRETACRTV